MPDPQDENPPKYMCLKGKTQYEMAQAIDSAAAQAEQAFRQDVQQVALQIWYEQFEQQVLDELNIYQDALPVVSVETEGNFIGACGQLWQFTLSYDMPSKGMALGATRVQSMFRQSFMDAVDMLKARGMWRFDLQRYLQKLQGTVMDECQQRKPCP